MPLDRTVPRIDEANLARKARTQEIARYRQPDGPCSIAGADKRNISRIKKSLKITNGLRPAPY